MSEPSKGQQQQQQGPRYLVNMRELERELNQQMKLLQGPGTAPLQRARMSNLVIFCNSLEQAILLNEQVPAISAVHPARVLLLVGEPGGNRDLTARVTVRPIGSGQKSYACAEQVTLHTAGPSVDRLPFAVRALVIGDLPINLWWSAPIPPPLGGALLHDLGENAQQIIYDSLGWPDPARGVGGTASWLENIERPGGRWRVASDLNWRRLKYWRRMVSQALEPASAPGAAETVSEILVEHGPHAVIQGWLLVSWLTLRLGWRVHGGKMTPGVEMSWRFATPKGDARVRVKRLEEGPPEVRKLRIACTLDSKPAALTMTQEGTQRLSLLVEGSDSLPRTLTTPVQSPVDLIGRQLSDRERDVVFRDSMAVAQVMAQSVLPR
jgi:glucose-6-phosphate dehydrogenase assembly protein OpcA